MEIKIRRFAALFAGCLFAWLWFGPVDVAHGADTKPDVFLLKTDDGSRDVEGWVMSEKLDGVRGLWDGKRFLSRGGKVLHAPAWFIRGFPPFALDGELWTRRGDFENIVSIVRRKTPDNRWTQVRYHVFEVPRQSGGLPERLAVLADYLQAHANADLGDGLGDGLNERLKIIPQIKINARAQLTEFLAEVSAGGGEGVVVRDPDSPYQTGRLSSALKVKNHFDAECVVRKILPGKGKYTGKMGALQCRMASGRLIKIGTGFRDKTRAQPPPVGSVVTFKYYGLTKKGNPRFPVYLRKRL